MLLKKIKLTLSAFLLLTATNAAATSYPQPDRVKSTSANSNAKTLSTGEIIVGKNGYTLDARYDDSSFNFTDYDTQNNTVTDVLFFYTKEALEEMGHIENIHIWVNENIKFNNKALENGQIPITRRVAAIIPMNKFERNLTASESIALFIEKNVEYSFSAYKASYFVLINSHTVKGDSNAIGVGQLGGNLSVITVNKDKAYLRLLAHELGHNDGLEHDGEGAYNFLEPYAIGYNCNNFASALQTSVEGRYLSREVPFFSNPTITSNDIECGISGRADSSRAYRKATDGGTFEEKSNSFRDIKDTKPVNGTITFNVSEVTISETVESFAVDFTWSGAPDIYSSIEVYTEHASASESDAAYVAKRVYFEFDSQEVIINLNNDTLKEEDEVFYVKFRQPNGIEVEGISEIKVTVTSDEVPEVGVISFKSDAISLTEGANATLTLIRTGGSDTEVSVNLKSSHNTTSNSDINLIDEVVTFADGETSKTITITAKTDTLDESDETFDITLTGDYVSNNDNATITIVNVKEEPPTKQPAKDNSGKGDESGGGTGSFSLMMLGLLLLSKCRFSSSSQRNSKQK
jgi:hypothetical protein